MLLLTAGCRDNKHPELRRVKGRVLYLEEPVTDAVLAFYSDDSARAATGRTDEQGNFYLTTFEDNDGAVPGEHIVVVSKTDTPEDDTQLSMDEAAKAPRTRVKKSRQLLPARYASVSTSPLRFTINEKEPNDLTIELSDD
jgi:hypothetical protein